MDFLHHLFSSFVLFFRKKTLTFIHFKSNFCSFPHISFSFSLYATGNWSSGWIDLCHCGRCRSDINRLTPESSLLTRMSFNQICIVFIYHFLINIKLDHNNCPCCVTAHFCTPSCLLIPPTLFYLTAVTPSFLSLVSLLYYLCSILCWNPPPPPPPHHPTTPPPSSLQVLVAFISFSETMLLVYLSYKVSYSASQKGQSYAFCDVFMQTEWEHL